MDKRHLNYQGQDVYVGLDVHKKSYAVIARAFGEVVKRASVPADPEILSKSLMAWFPGAIIHTAYEAGFSGFCLHRILTNNGIDSSVVNAASVEVAANDKKKCDRRDANKLSEQLAAGRLVGIYIPKIEEELHRQITRTREQLVKEKNRIANQIKSKLHYFGYIRPEDDRIMGKTFILWTKSLNLPDELRWSLNLLIENWAHLYEQIEAIKVDLQVQAFEDSEIEAIYRSVPGVGAVSSRILSNELGDLSKRFKNQKSLYQYTGLTPSEHSSGEHIHKGHIDRQGPPRIRQILVQISWKAIQIDGVLNEYFKKIAKHRGKKIAIVAVARKLIGRIRACFLYKQLYATGLVA